MRIWQTIDTDALGNLVRVGRVLSTEGQIHVQVYQTLDATEQTLFVAVNSAVNHFINMVSTRTSYGSR